MKYLFVVLLAVLCCLPGKAQQKKYKAYFVADAHRYPVELGFTDHYQ